VTVAYYHPLEPGRFRSTEEASGAWDVGHQHMSPVAGLLVDAMEACAPRAGLQLARVTFEILGVLAGGEVEVAAEVVRPGRTIELVQAELRIAGRTAVRATGWRLQRTDTADVAGSRLEPMPGPDEGAPFAPERTWQGGYIRSLEFRVLPGWEPGSGRVWLRSRAELVAGVATSELAGMFALVDTANGVSVRVAPQQLLFPNVDLTVHLFRRPRGPWLGLATEVSFGPDGLGLTAAVLHDLDGPFGRSAQLLTLRPPGG
jgi:hypothetical protein